MATETAKRAVFDTMNKWNPSWRISKADLPPIPAALDKGSELISRGLDKSAAALAAAWDKLGPLARWYYEHVFDQTPLTQLARCFYLTLGLQMLAGFLPHAVMGKEGQYRFLNGLNFLLIATFTLFTQPDWGLRKLFVFAMVAATAIRGMSSALLPLFAPSDAASLDKRFAAIRSKPVSKLVYWLSQVTWVMVSMLPVILLNSNDTPVTSYTLPGKPALPRELHTPLGTVQLPEFLRNIRGFARHGQWGDWSWHNLCRSDYLGIAIWLAGFALECVSDFQRNSFEQSLHKSSGNISVSSAAPSQASAGAASSGSAPASYAAAAAAPAPAAAGSVRPDGSMEGLSADSALHSKFLNTGLWKYTRNPNLLGQCLCAIGLAMTCWAGLTGLKQSIAAILSPLLVIFGVVAVSGVPMSEDAKERRYGSNAMYQAYKKKTPVIMPFVF